MNTSTNSHLLTDNDPPAFAALYRIYRAALPASERKPEAALRAMTHRPDYRVLVARDDATRVLGFAIVFAPRTPAIALLEYLAVDEHARGAGIGADLFRAACATLRAENSAVWLLAEVDAEFGDDATDRAAQRRRQAFYRRLGCRRIAGLRYELPLRTSGAPLPPPMQLFVYADPPDPVLGRQDLGRALRAIYHDVYGQPPDDPRVARMLASVPDPVVFD